MKELIVKVDDAGVYHIEGELIRCKDCKYGYVKSIKNNWYGTVKAMWCDDSNMYTLKQWCSRAERKNDHK